MHHLENGWLLFNPANSAAQLYKGMGKRPDALIEFLAFKLPTS